MKYLLFSLLLLYTSLADSSYPDCIITNMKGVSSDTAAAAIEAACRMKWEKKASNDLSEPSKTSEVESTQQISSEPPERERLDNRSNNNESSEVDKSVSELLSTDAEPTKETSDAGAKSDSNYSADDLVAQPEEIDLSTPESPLDSVQRAIGYGTSQDRKTVLSDYRKRTSM